MNDIPGQVFDLTRRLNDAEERLANIPILPAGGGGTPANMWKLTNGSAIYPAGVIGAARTYVADPDTHTIALVSDLIAPTSLDPGVGIAQNVSTGALSLVWNGSPGSVLFDLWKDEVFLSYDSIAFGVTGATDRSTQTFLIPTPPLA